jgi:hypothetical protein
VTCALGSPDIRGICHPFEDTKDHSGQHVVRTGRRKAQTLLCKVGNERGCFIIILVSSKVFVQLQNYGKECKTRKYIIGS